MRSISSSNHRNCYRPPTAIMPMRPSNAVFLSLLQEHFEKGWRQDATLANSDSCLKPFICVTIGHHRAGALFIGL